MPPQRRQNSGSLPGVTTRARQWPVAPALQASPCRCPLTRSRPFPALHACRIHLQFSLEHIDHAARRLPRFRHRSGSPSRILDHPRHKPRMGAQRVQQRLFHRSPASSISDQIGLFALWTGCVPRRRPGRDAVGFVGPPCIRRSIRHWNRIRSLLRIRFHLWKVF